MVIHGGVITPGIAPGMPIIPIGIIPIMGQAIVAVIMLGSIHRSMIATRRSIPIMVRDIIIRTTATIPIGDTIGLMMIDSAAIRCKFHTRVV